LFCTMRMRVLSSVTETHSTPSRLTLLACQTFGFFFRITRSPLRHSSTVNPHEVTGDSEYAASPILVMAFSDRIDTVGEASCERKATAGVFKVTTRVCGSLALAVLIRLNGSLHSEALLSRMRNRLKAASSAVIGEPSENFAARSLK